jgi:multidrug efflux pump
VPNEGRFNLSRWALEHIPLTRYLMAALLMGGIISLRTWGRTKIRRSPSA